MKKYQPILTKAVARTLALSVKVQVLKTNKQKTTCGALIKALFFHMQKSSEKAVEPTVGNVSSVFNTEYSQPDSPAKSQRMVVFHNVASSGWKFVMLSSNIS